MRRLIVNPGTESAWEIPLQTGLATLGRETDNHLVIEHPSVSGHHCEFMVMDSGVTVKDLGSSNGTFVDGQPVEESILLPGQALQLGEVRLQLAQVLTPVATIIAPIVESAHCKFHPRSRARFRCPKCRGNFCDLCVNTRSAGGLGKYFCRACAAECLTLSTPVRPEEAEDPAFTREAFGAFKYPLNGDGLMLIAVGAFFFLLLDGAKMLAFFAPVYGWAALGSLTVFGVGYLTVYLRLNLSASALGEDKMPDWPEMSGIVSAFFELVGTVAFSFAPAIGLTIYAAVYGGDGDTAWLGWATTALILLGCVYFPMAFTAVAMYDSITAVNPLLIIPSIAKVVREYLLTVVLLAFILIVRWFLKNYLAMILPVPLVPTILSSLLGLYLLIVEMRILGLLYRNKKHELGWFT